MKYNNIKQLKLDFDKVIGRDALSDVYVFSNLWDNYAAAYMALPPSPFTWRSSQVVWPNVPRRSGYIRTSTGHRWIY